MKYYTLLTADLLLLVVLMMILGMAGVMIYVVLTNITF